MFSAAVERRKQVGQIGHLLWLKKFRFLCKYTSTFTIRVVIKLFSIEVKVAAHSARSFRNSVLTQCIWSFGLFQVYMARSLKALEFQEVFVVTTGVKKRKIKFCQEDARMVKLDM
jgi:hypothetical protein